MRKVTIPDQNYYYYIQASFLWNWSHLHNLCILKDIKFKQTKTALSKKNMGEYQAEQWALLLQIKQN